jgi:MoxR-like ATPase
MTEEDRDRELPDQMLKRVRGLEEEIRRAVIGQQQVVREVVIGLLAAGHVMVEGLPGLGKTLLVRSIAAAVGGKFNRIQFTPDLMPSDISGHIMFDMKSETFRVRKGPIFCNFLLADEINRAPAKTQSALLEVMQEQQVSIEGRTLSVEKPFLVLATQNPIEHEGTYPLPQAQLDRFLLKVFIDFPKEEEEQAMVRQVTENAVGDLLDTSAVRTILQPDEILQLQMHTARLKVDDQIVAYAVRIVRAAREWNGVEVGAGPRGSIALLRAARAHALLQGNGFVTPDDVKAVAPAVLRHRLKLTTDLEIEGYSPDDILSDILLNVDAPRI